MKDPPPDLVDKVHLLNEKKSTSSVLLTAQRSLLGPMKILVGNFTQGPGSRNELEE